MSKIYVQEELLCENLTSSILTSGAINLICPIHQSLNKYYSKKQKAFVCEYDGFDHDGGDSFLNMPQILEKYREEILYLQSNLNTVQNHKYEDIIPLYISKVKNLNLILSKFSHDIDNFKNNLLAKIMFLLRSSNNIYEIQDLINQVKFNKDGKPDLKHIGMNEQKEKDLIFLTQFLVYRDNEKQQGNNLTEKFIYF